MRHGFASSAVALLDLQTDALRDGGASDVE
jgi:hypothetical protein